MVKLHELFRKGLVIKAVFSLAPLPRRPCLERPHAVWAEASTPQTTSFAGRLSEVRTPKVTTRLRWEVSRPTLGLTVADR